MLTVPQLVDSKARLTVVYRRPSKPWQEVDKMTEVKLSLNALNVVSQDMYIY